MRSDRLPAYGLESLQGAVLPPAPFATQGGEDVEEEVETEEKKPKAEKKKIRKDKKSKKSKKKKEIAGREEEENLAIPAVGPAMEECPMSLVCTRRHALPLSELRKNWARAVKKLRMPGWNLRNEPTFWLTCLSLR